MADEAKLLAQIKKGEERAIDRAVGLYTPYLSTVLYNMASNLSKEDTEEIVSDEPAKWLSLQGMLAPGKTLST